MFTPHVVKSPTSNDVALAAGVSRATVSFVLNDKQGARVSEDTKHRVRQAAHMLGYTPNAAARSLAVGETASGFLFPSPSQDFGDSVYNAFEQVLEETSDEGIDTVRVNDVDLSGAEIGTAWAKYRPESVLADSTRCDESATEVLRLSGVRALIVYGSQPVGYAPCLEIPQEPLGAMAVAHLIALGHRRISYLVPTRPESQEIGAGRLRGVEQVCATSGVSLRVVHSGIDNESLRDWAHSWRYDSGHSTGLVAVDGRHAVAAIRALADANVRVPDDVSVVSAEESLLTANYIPRVSSVALDSQILAHSLLGAFAKLRNGVRVDRVPTPQSKLIPRESTGPV
jgi:DNA-binding LacI/PurR family transcriptional regulator